MKLLRIQTDIEWVRAILETPFIGAMFLFLQAFLPAIVASDLFTLLIPGVNHQKSYSYCMHVLFPVWNYIVWRYWIRITFLRIAAWEIAGVISILILIVEWTK